MGYLKESHLRVLQDYKYTSEGCTPLDKLLNYYWEAVTKLFPSYVTPNLITATGFMCLVASYLIIFT